MDLTMTNWAPETWINRGAELIASDPGMAQRMLAQGIRQMPDQGIAWFNLGLALHQRRRVPAAIKAYRHALNCAAPPVNEATTNLAQDLLLIGAFEEGWQLYENRFTSLGGTSWNQYTSNFGSPWEGFHDPRPCEHLVVVCEQGYGDTLQFCRLVVLLEQHGISTSLFCQESLTPFLRSCSDIVNIELTLTRQGRGVRWCPLLSLPHRLRINHDNIPFASGYLTAEPERISAWKQRLKRQSGKRLIALHWQGNPKFEKKLYSRGRSMPFSAWEKLAGLPGIEFLSIQKGAGNEQLRTDTKLPFVAGQREFDASFDFRDTAAALANCDLLLSADSSVVHLAGAMGLPTWIALSWVPEWRWGLEGDSTPWYSSARLFRQSYANDWESVVDAMAKALNTAR
jgi:hypothetical protein